MATTTDELPDLESEALRLTEHLGNLKMVNAGLGAAAERVEHAGAALDAAHETLRKTESRIASLNGDMSAALATLDRLEPDTLRSTVDAGFATARADLEHLHQRLAGELDGIAGAVRAQGSADSERHLIVVKSVAESALRVIDAVEQAQRQIDACQAAMQHGFAELRMLQAAMSETLATLQDGQRALAKQAKAISSATETINATIDIIRTSSTAIEQVTTIRLPALAADVQTLRQELANEASSARRRQYVLFVATILLVAFLIGLAFRFFGAP